MFRIEQQILLSTKPENLDEAVQLITYSGLSSKNRIIFKEKYIPFVNYYVANNSLVFFTLHLGYPTNRFFKNWYFINQDNAQEFILIKELFWKKIFTDNSYVVSSAPLKLEKINKTIYENEKNNSSDGWWDRLNVSTYQVSSYREIVDELLSETIVFD
jgi:hypothetical protein